MNVAAEPLTKKARRGLRKEARARRQPRAVPPPPAELPTAERIAKAGDGYRSVIVDGERCTRVDDAPFDRMRARGQLHADKDISDMLYEAGERWRRDWYMSGLSGVGAIDYSRNARGEGDSPSSMPTSERSMKHRQAFRTAWRVMSEHECRVVGGVVLDERTLFDIGCEVYGARRRSAVLEAASESLRGGLRALARHYGLGRA